MKKMMGFLFLSIAGSAIAQHLENKLTGVMVTGSSPATDTTIKVVYVTKSVNGKQPAYYLNEQFVNQTLLETLNPQEIESIDVIKRTVNIDGNEYNGEVRIKTKHNYQPKIISLTGLKEKYTNLKNTSTICMIDGNIISGDYDQYVIDENYVLSITVDKIDSPKQNLEFALMKVLTRTAENIKKSQQIRIRGVGETAIK